MATLFMAKSTHRFVTRVDGRPIPGMSRSDVARMTRACRKIRQRTGWQGWYHRLDGAVQFHPSDRGHGGSVSDVVRSNGQTGRYLPIDEDLVCKQIYSTRIGRKAQDAIIETNERLNHEIMQEQIADIARDMSPELLKMSEFARRKAHSVHSEKYFVMNAPSAKNAGSTLIGV